MIAIDDKWNRSTIRNINRVEYQMKYLLFVLLIILIGCSRSERSYTSNEYKQTCRSICQEDYGTDVDWVGGITGKCYCK